MTTDNTLNYPDAWDEYLLTHRPDIGYKQSSWWARFLATRGWGSFGVFFGEGENVLGGARVLVYSFAPAQCYYYIPDGPVLPEAPADAHAMFAELIVQIDEHRQRESFAVSHLRLEPHWVRRPEFVQGCREASSWKEPRDTLCVDLQQTDDAILKQMKPKGRYNIGLARRKGVSVVEDTSPQGLADFIRLYKETFKRHGIGRHSSNYFRKLHAALVEQDTGAIFFAEYEGIRLATAMVLYFGNTATYKYGGSTLLHRNLMAPYLLHFEAMRAAQSRGYRWYDFYGISAADNPHAKWANFSAFKRKFGGQEFNFIPSLDFIYDKDAYRIYRKS